MENAEADAPIDESPDREDPRDEASTRPRASRKAAATWAIGVGAVMLVGAAAAAVHVVANRTYDAAHADLEAAVVIGIDAEERLDLLLTGIEGSLLSAGQILDSSRDDLVDATARAAFETAVAAQATVAADAETVLDEGVDDGTAEKPAWTWELFGEASALDERARAVEDTIDRMDEARTRLDDSGEPVDTAARALYASAAAPATAFEAAHVSANAVVVLDFRDAAEAVVGQTAVGSGAAVAFSTYAQRAEALTASSASELAEKAGPLMGTRLEIEAYARSIAGGVVLDFDWAQIVAGTGGSAGMGGTATWNAVRGGFSTITLSHSVAEEWPDANARALVAHEVGHAITSKCSDKFDSADDAANEEWATAWAISMGHTAEGNGVYAYGYPSQAMIDIAATCR
ncbi:hypothetical protein [Microbacterium sp. SLBN-146]|uniref:hypothetical protein n=1 Tax=Microbacterium sp. SLBN-146 TaxID=2768457 RepID=UPI001151F7F2|nr:hypothetical protein [Microbacterium sp. SLBN-146]TQJ31307.1 hypothetical protein FBY39_1771 [Microbacterium sp. SLBN-146]